MTILVYLVIFSLPLYLLRLKIFGIPTTVLELMIYTLFIAWLVSMLRFNLPRRVEVKPLQALSIVLLLAGGAVSTLVTPYKITSLGILKGWFIDPLLFFVVLTSVVKTRAQIKKALISFSLSGLVVAIISLVYLIRGNLTFDNRLRAIFLSSNHLAMYLAPALLVTSYLLVRAASPRPYVRYFWFAVLVLISIPLYFTFSYGAWLGVSIGLLFLLWSFAKNLDRKKKKAILLYCSIALLLVVILGVFQLRTEKFQNFLYSTRSSWQSRLMIWKAGLLILKDHPLWGIGLGTFQKYYLDYSSYFKKPYLEWAVPQPHNLFLAFWLQTGILGLIGFIWIIVSFLKSGFRLILNSKLLIPNFLVAVMIYILIHGLVDSTYWKNDLAVIFWMIIGLMVVLSCSFKD